MSLVRVNLSDGIVEGRVDNGVRSFFSVPYAAPLTQERRFREPQPAERWEGVRDATVIGPSAPQNPARLAGIDMTPVMGAASAQGPDYLTLNLWTPDGEVKDRPVMVFIHGGAFVGGSKDSSAYNGRSFARDGIVCVTLNYRLGIEGFLPIPGVPTNLGLRDIIAALHWVRDNIAVFGGDPGNITLFGESAGAVCVSLLMLSPPAQGLFRRAICESGHPHLTRDIPLMQRVVKRLARRLRITPDKSGFLRLSAQQLLPAQAWVMRPSLLLDLRDGDRRDLALGGRFVPVHGDDVVPQRPLEALRAGAGKSVDLLIGTTAQETNLFFVPGGVGERIRRWQARLLMRTAIPDGRSALRAYGFDEKGARPGEVLTRTLTDLLFRCISRRTAELHQGRCWVFEFDWPSTALGGKLGAAHTIELPFVFDTLAAASGNEGLLGADPPQALADSIHALWVRFGTDGYVPWPEYERVTQLVYSLTRGAAAHEPTMPAAGFLP